jgi:DNA-directed RNA polymerase subunit RPC12/RpoP
MAIDQGYEDEDGGGDDEAGRARRFADFDCPDCAANNPYDDAFGDGDEIRCYYCGQEFLVQVNDSGRLKLKAV